MYMYTGCLTKKLYSMVRNVIFVLFEIVHIISILLHLYNVYHTFAHSSMHIDRWDIVLTQIYKVQFTYNVFQLVAREIWKNLW